MSHFQCLQMPMSIYHRHNEIDDLSLREVLASLCSFVDDVFQTGYSFFHLNETFPTRIELAEFLLDYIAPLKLYYALMRVFIQEIQQLYLSLECPLSIAIHQDDLLYALHIVLVVFIDTFVHFVTAFVHEGSDGVVCEDLAISIDKFNLLHKQYRGGIDSKQNQEIQRFRSSLLR